AGQDRRVDQEDPPEQRHDVRIPPCCRIKPATPPSARPWVVTPKAGAGHTPERGSATHVVGCRAQWAPPLYAVIMDVRPSWIGADDSPEGNKLDMFSSLVRRARAGSRVLSSGPDRTAIPTSRTARPTVRGRERHGPP